MTFEQWWSRIHFYDPATQANMKAAFEACWNAALEAVCGTKFYRAEFPPPIGLPEEIRDQIRAMKAGA